MGCVSSKNIVAVTPLVDSSGILSDRWEIIEEVSEPSGRFPDLKELLLEVEKEEVEEKDEIKEEEEEEAVVAEKENAKVVSFRLGNLHRYIEGEQVAAGWPTWLSAVAGEAIQGWVPLRAEDFEKLEKIGQGTYSNVFRARHLDTGKIFALKKVRFDNLEPESVRFMAREIQIIRRLDHPNVIKLEGLITSQLSCSLYLVFEYMEHDLAGLSSSPDIKFSESQRKCYLKQLLSGMEHCHSRGIIHRDIKGANLLVNNQGILKIADFGLANFYKPEKRQPLTSRVVTLWYRPPELLLGSTDYGPTVDVWSVGCVFAEMFTGKPIMQGRTEVEQLHKIFKLCGSPPEEYWKKSKLPHATIFKPHRPYENCLQGTFQNLLPDSAVDLLKSLLAVEPYKRSTASSALASDYFSAEPYACEPSTLPRYPPNKEIDAKYREDLQRRKVAARARGVESTRSSKVTRGAKHPNDTRRAAEKQEVLQKNFNAVKRNDTKQDLPNTRVESRMFVDLQPLPTLRPPVHCHTRHSSQESIPFSGPAAISSSGAAPSVKRQAEQRVNARSHRRSLSKTNLTSVLDSVSIVPAKINSYIKGQENGLARPENRDGKPHELRQRSMTRKWRRMERPESFDNADVYRSQDFSGALSKGSDLLSTRHNTMDQKDRIEFSGPLLSHSHKVDELLQKNERHIRQAIKKSWLQRVTSRRQEK